LHATHQRAIRRQRALPSSISGRGSRRLHLEHLQYRLRHEERFCETFRVQRAAAELALQVSNRRV
jgi:hypothetical protein